MIDQLIKFETAKLAKEKGFPQFISMEEVKKGISSNILMYYPDHSLRSIWFNPYDYVTYRVATQSLLQKWLREIHGLHIIIFSGYSYVVHKNSYHDGDLSHNYDYKSYEEALEQGLIDGLNMIE